MVSKHLKIGSRSSQLARRQVDEAIDDLRTVLGKTYDFQTSFYQTPGDRDKETSLLDDSIPDDFFTRDLDNACLDGDFDIGVHSAKDLPETCPEGIVVAALLPARDIRDALVFCRDAPEDFNPTTIGTSSSRRVETARMMFPDATRLDIRGDLISRIKQLDRGDFDAIVVAACALERLGMADRISQYLLFNPAPQQGRLALTVRAKDKELLNLLRSVDVRRTAGLVAILGCPADPAMISSRISRYLCHADIVLHDRLVPSEVLALLSDKLVNVGKTGGQPSIPQSEINRKMLMEAERGRLVVRLQGGDPGIFGHLGEEVEFLSQWNIRVDVVPAASAAQVAAARARIPLTHRNYGRSITLATGHPAPGQDLPSFPGPEHGHLALYMVTKNRKAVLQRLFDGGWPTEASVLIAECIGTDEETSYFTTLQDLALQPIQSPALLLVGPRAPTLGPTTLFTGTDPSHFLRHGPLLHWPMIELAAEPLAIRRRYLEEHLDRVNGILFPSRFAVSCFVDALFPRQDVRALAGKHLLAVGPSTEDELKKVGLKADLAAQSLGGVRALADKISKKLTGCYLYPCSDAAPREARRAFLQPFGIDLEPVVFYGNLSTPEKPLPKLPFHRVLFTSSSTVKTYFDRYPVERNADRIWLSVGPSTLEALEKRGLEGEMLTR